MTAPAAHVGRFAPSPTGPLHFGSLIAALASHAAARAAGGRWLLRIDDIDPPREQAGAADRIRRQLEGLGLLWDGPVVFQGGRDARYRDALDRLAADGHLFACHCSRREIRAVAGEGPLGAVYPGTCRARTAVPTPPDAALRLRIDEDWLSFDDAVQGHCAIEATCSIGDVVVRRRDGLVAYHLANAVDDAELGITEVVRGADLLPAAFVQIALDRRLGHASPRWTHLPVALAASGDKLSKQTGAEPIDERDPVTALLEAWHFLGQPMPPECPPSQAAFHAFAAAHWDPARIPAQTPGGARAATTQ